MDEKQFERLEIFFELASKELVRIADSVNIIKTILTIYFILAIVNALISLIR